MWSMTRRSQVVSASNAGWLVQVSSAAARSRRNGSSYTAAISA